ncbi:hypothetical protein F5X99DRAFT_427854 [Biscogniauxia marginata]|nr:hypothetical protein F5X99DRAFT_427854 [Biscogniauxia marginata]
MDASSSTIRVAILGGGLTGAALLRGLLRYPQIAADIYDSRPILKEEGLGLVLEQNTENILRAIDPSLDNCLDRAGAVRSFTEIRVAAGPDSGRKVDAKGFGGPIKRTVGRQAFLSELIRGLPPRLVHPNTRLTTITELPDGGGLILAFADGSQKKYDVVVSTDGVHMIGRQHVLGADDPALKPEHTRVWGLPIKVPLSTAQSAMGEDFVDPKNPSQLVWVGDGTMMQHNLQDDGKEVHISTYIRQDDFADDNNTWARLFTPEEFSDSFAKNELHACKGMVNLIRNMYTVQITGISQMQHKPAHSYVTKTACLIGDAAHSMHLFPGASVVLGLEEALVLSTLLGRIPSRETIPAALKAFDHVCRPRAEQAMQHSSECGLLLTGKAPGIGLDADLLAQHLKGKWDFLVNVDIEALQSAAVNTMDQMLTSGW